MSRLLPTLVNIRKLEELLKSSDFYGKFRIVEANVGNDALEQYNKFEFEFFKYFL